MLGLSLIKGEATGYGECPSGERGAGGGDRATLVRGVPAAVGGVSLRPPCPPFAVQGGWFGRAATTFIPLVWLAILYECHDRTVRTAVLSYIPSLP
jgi:hypothetical protein